MTYEYICAACGHQWEAEQSIKDEPLKECPKCCEPEAKRQISGGQGFILKGGGWYADGYGSKGTGVESSSATSNTDKEPSKKSESKATPSSQSESSTTKSPEKKTKKKDGTEAA